MTAIDLRRRLFKALLDTCVVPALASSEDLDVAVGALKRGVVSYLDHQGMPKEATARHCSKSDRWVYRCLRESNEETPEGLGYQIMVAAVTFLQNRFPGTATLEECIEAASCVEPMAAKDMEDLLQLYSRLGYVHILNGPEGKRFKAADNVLEDRGDQHPKSVARLYERLALVWPLARAYANGQEGAEFGRLTGYITRKQYRILQRRIKVAVREAVAEAMINSMDEDPDEMDRVPYCGLFALGMDVQGLDGGS